MTKRPTTPEEARRSIRHAVRKREAAVASWRRATADLAMALEAARSLDEPLPYRELVELTGLPRQQIYTLIGRAGEPIGSKAFEGSLRGRPSDTQEG